MINFFRKIRKRLADDNKPLKYMRYAIGEIVLVVIGILIALQINNWNENRNNRTSEIEILKIIHDNLLNDLDDFEKNIIHFKNRKEASNTLLQLSENNIKYHDSLSFYMYYTRLYPHFTPNTSGFELLKSKGLNLISNDSLKIELTNLYEYGYKYLFTLESENIEYNLNTLFPRLLNYEGINTIGVEDIPNSLDNSRGHLTNFALSQLILNIENFHELKSDTKLLAIFAEIKGNSNLIRHIHEQVEEKVIKIVDQLEIEIQ